MCLATICCLPFTLHLPKLPFQNLYSLSIVGNSESETGHSIKGTMLQEGSEIIEFVYIDKVGLSWMAVLYVRVPECDLHY